MNWQNQVGEVILFFAEITSALQNSKESAVCYAEIGFTNRSCCRHKLRSDQNFLTFAAFEQTYYLLLVCVAFEENLGIIKKVKSFAHFCSKGAFWKKNS